MLIIHDERILIQHVIAIVIKKNVPRGTFFGGPCGIRTRHLFHAMEALYQMS